MVPLYKRVMIKVSGEALSGGAGTGIDGDTIGRVADAIKKVRDLGCEVGVVTGGGNFWRGARNGLVMERSRADHMGMLATVMNCLALSETLENRGVPTTVFSAVPMPLVAESYSVVRAQACLAEGRVALFAGGTGCPYFTTDTGVVLKGIEMHADLILLAKNVDGIYSDDPKKNPDAVRFDEISCEEVLARGLKATDATAMSLLMENRVPVLLFSLEDPEVLVRGVMGEKIGTVLK
ncbi:MAG: UMP kinase [Clostridia bacterium]|nr:UMP kinase [Clostridia bacterium]MBR5742364.1 UMP kinase [Clostridia bacterium]